MRAGLIAMSWAVLESMCSMYRIFWYHGVVTPGILDLRTPVRPLTVVLNRASFFCLSDVGSNNRCVATAWTTYFGYGRPFFNVNNWGFLLAICTSTCCPGTHAISAHSAGSCGHASQPIAQGVNAVFVTLSGP
ncbi:hypothetical protein C8R44DRAFT_175187 [Mycena epipterygia]|nr:hypothetical protein C8R44DRAFT_175187 [Mycena epipterygia]